MEEADTVLCERGWSVIEERQHVTRPLQNSETSSCYKGREKTRKDWCDFKWEKKELMKKNNGFWFHSEVAQF